MSDCNSLRLSRRAVLALLGAGASASAQLRDRPIQLYVGYPAGGGTDYVARLLAQRLQPLLGQPVLVVNLPAATGAIALERVVKSPPDGQTLVVLSAADTLLPALRANLGFDLRRDLLAVAPAAAGALAVVVNPQLPVRTLRDLIELARARPGALNFSSPGVGNSQHLAGETFNRLAGVQIVHVPFKGGAEAMNAVIAGDVQLAFPSIAPALPMVQAGRLRLLAVTPAQRSTAVPQTPTVAEAGVPGDDVSTWFGVAAPAGTPRELLLRLNDAVSRAMAAPETREALMKQGLEPMGASVDQFGAFVQAEMARNAQLAREIGLHAS